MRLLYIGSNTYTMPAATDTLVGRASVDTLTNKTINASSNTITNVTQSMLNLTLSSQANSGTAGGTMYYINLGGIKLLWLTGATCVTGNSATVVFPASFFSTVISVVPGMAQASGTAAVYFPEARNITATGFTIFITVSAGAGTEPLFSNVTGT